ncbi:FIP1[V]-like protein isoform X1 [Camellia sinensis]|uniref:FIP1[V]-like protein isoform X1 n=1 Tax=Camellia sinensis TaxID=4442 RepID=UPI0010357DC9|nr:FIP1[V]-like protein isoform X1 [Camellia sinensis]
MEDDDDEFGDLYTDVLRPFQSSALCQNRPIDLNIQSDDEDILFGAPNINPIFNLTSSHQNQTLVFKSDKAAPELGLASSSDSHRNLNLNLELDGKQQSQEVEKEDGLAEGVSNLGSDLPKPSVPRVLESGGDVKFPNLTDESGIDVVVVVEERDDKDDLLVAKDEGSMDKNDNFEKFNVKEVNTGIVDLGSEPVIPGLSIPGVSDAVDNRGSSNFVVRDEASGDGDDWDSDSEDDLQIVLNDNNHGPMAMGKAGLIGSDDEDEDGEPLVIVADSEPGHQPIEEQEWGEDAAQAADGERKELGDAAKVNGGMVVPPKIGYSNHPYQPYHSQFKYVRPGAAPMPGAAPVSPGGALGQVRPPVNVGTVAGRGRGDWRPAGIKNAALVQKSFLPGFGTPVWGNNTPGRGFGSGLDFTLPSHKTIFDVDIDSFEEKPWRLPGIDISDFFNFGLNEENWKDYCKQLEQLRLEATMQSKIRVYESGRTEQEYDPDLPPELAAAAGINDISSENGNLGKMDAGQSDIAKGSARVRPPLPTGRAIQVETGYGERLPSIDTRPPRIRDSDAIIEIVLQDSADDDSIQGNDVIEQPENDSLMEDFRGGHEIKRDVAEEDAVHFDGSPQAYNGRKRELIETRAPFMNPVQDNLTEGDGSLPLLPEAPVQHPNFGGQTSAYSDRDVGTLYEERQTKGRTRDRSPNMTCSGSILDKRFLDNQKEGSVESIGGEHNPRLSSPVTVGSTEDLDDEHGDGLRRSSSMDREELALDTTTTTTDTRIDENLSPSMKKQKISLRVEQSSLQEIDDGGHLKASISSENSRDNQKFHDSVDEEVVQLGRSTRMVNLKRPNGEDEQRVRRKGRDERREMGKNRLVEKGREDLYSHRDWDPHSAHQSHRKTEGIDRRKERENSEGAWQWQDDDSHGMRTRAEDTRKRERGDEIGSRQRNKVQESERMDKDEHLQLRKQLDNGNSRAHHDKDVRSRHKEKDDNMRSRYENMGDHHRKRRKEEEPLRRDAEKEETLRGHRENSSHRKRERDDALDLRKRDEQVRTRDDDQLSVRHKEEIWIHRERGERQRERDERHMIKQSHEESLSKREREEERGGVRSARAVEEKSWVSHARLKDEYKGSVRDYQFKDTGRLGEPFKRRDRVEDGSPSQHMGWEDVHARGNQRSIDERRSRQERASTRDRAVTGSDNNRAHEKKYKKNTRKSRESEGGEQNSERNQEDQIGRMNEPVKLKGTTVRGNGEHEILLIHHSSRKHREDDASDDERQNSRRGRSKLERWTSHKERDFNVNSKSSSSLTVEETDKFNNGGSFSLASKLPNEFSKTIETIENQHPLGDKKDGGDLEIENVNAKSLDGRHLDTVEKLKKRSERFKLPMPSEKEAMVIKKMESEPLPSTQSEARADSEIKPERPARKRRWISN